MNTDKTRLDPSLMNLDGGVFGALPRVVLPLEVFRLDVPFELAPARSRIDSLMPVASPLGEGEDAVSPRPQARRSAWTVGLAAAAAMGIAAAGATHPARSSAAPAAAAAIPAQALPIVAPVLAAAPAAPPPVAAEPVKVASVARAAVPHVEVAAPAAAVPPIQPVPETTAELDRAAASRAISGIGARAGACREEAGFVSMPVSVTFSTSGRVVAARVTGGPLVGTPAGGCVAAALRGASIPAFAGEPVTINTTLRLQ